MDENGSKQSTPVILPFANFKVIESVVYTTRVAEVVFPLSCDVSKIKSTVATE